MVNEGYEEVTFPERLAPVNVRKLMLAGVFQYKSGLFKIPTFRRWMVLPASAEIIQEIKNAPDDVVSTRERAAGVCTVHTASAHTQHYSH